MLKKIDALKEMARLQGTSYVQMKKAYELVFGGIRKVVMDEEQDIQLTGDITIFHKQLVERERENPKTKEKIVLPPKNAIRFKMGGRFRV